MTFNEYLAEIKGLLKDKYITIDWDNDDEVANKLNALCWVVAKRINDPAPPKEQRVKHVDMDPEWRGFK